MSFTIWGLFILFITVFILLFRGLKGIVEALIFTSTLFITVITTIPLGGTVLRTSYFFAIIFIVLFIGLGVLNPKATTFKRDLLPAYCFLLIITLSIFMPFFLQGDINVLGFNSGVGLVQSLSYEKLTFQQSNLTQLIYPYFQIILFTLLAAYLQTETKIKKTLNLLLKGGYVVLATGFLYITLLQLGYLGLPKWINFLITGSQHFKYLKSGGFLGLPRMASWAGEPGYTSFVLLMILGFLVGMILTNNYLGRRKRPIFFLFYVFLIGIIISGSTTAYIGFIILMIIGFTCTLITNNANFKIKKSYLILLFLGLVLTVTIFTGYFSTQSSVLNYFQKEQLSKLTEQTGSGLVRFTVVKHNFYNFLKSPLLGIGYGSERSLALSTFLLANTGALGFLSFSFWALYLLKKMWNILKSKFATNDQKTIALGLLVSFGTMTILMQFAKSESSLLFQYFWIVAACMLALNRLFLKRKKAILSQ